MAMPSHPTFRYIGLPAAAQLRVAVHPDAVSEWCQYNPDNYSIPVFIRGIFHDIYMGVITNLKATIVEPWLKEFIEDDPNAFLGDAFRHIEAGSIFPEEYVDIDREGESLAPVSGHHLNIITETDRTIEKWHIRISHNRDTFAHYFKDFSTFTQFMELLKGNMTKGINKSLGLIVKAAMCADPSQTSFDDKDIARIFGRTIDNPTAPVPFSGEDSKPASSALGRKWQKMMRTLISKYYGKSLRAWPNIYWYNPMFWSYDNYHEEMSKDFIFEEPQSGKDKAKRQMQQQYTDAHEGSPPDNTTHWNHHLWRVDSLIALVDAIVKALMILNTEESPEFWLGNDTATQIGQTKTGAERLKQGLIRQGLDGSPIGTDVPQANTNTSASWNAGFEVSASAEDLVLLLNPEDYVDLEIGVARRGQMDVRQVNLEMLRSRVSAIYPMRGMKSGYARLIDKRAFKIRSYFQLTDVQTPMEKLTWRYKTFYQFAVTMFQNFAGTLFVPSPHFTASSHFYNKHGLIGQEIVKKTA